ncbi:hypothetical protein PMAN_a0061 [Pseudoalteromonas marina]|nr:hypothetical protein PMAN_a0061 [Pseudoalteromonas marina]
MLVADFIQLPSNTQAIINCFAKKVGRHLSKQYLLVGF